MATGTRGTNTYSEWMRKMLGQIADAKTLPDADLEYLVNMETQLLGKIRAPIDNMQAAGSTAVPGAPSLMPGMPPGMPPGTMTSGAGGMGSMGAAPNGIMAPGGPRPPAVPGMRQGAAMPPLAELARVLGK